MYHYGEAQPVEDGDGGAVRTRYLRSLKDQVEQQLGERGLQAGPCPSFQVIEIAIAFESRFCSFFGGSVPATNIVQTIIAETSAKYGQFCKKVSLSHLEGHCNQAIDPYFNMFSGNVCSGDVNLLDQFRTFWTDNRQSIRRDVAHLFHAFAHPSSQVGCAFTGVVCDELYGYGVDEITFGGNDNQNLWAVLVAHELGHNAGAK
jgi:Metallo-peptidase family M12